MNIYNFALTNTLLLSISTLQYELFKLLGESYLTKVSILFGKNLLLLYIIEYAVRNKPYISKRDTNIGTCIPLVHVLTTTCIEALSYNQCGGGPVNIKDILLFIPLSFGFEIIFDFCHYWTHRGMHHPLIYKYIHKKHHTYSHPSPILTFYQSPIDILITNNIPLIISGSIIRLTPYQRSMMYVYKTFIEIAGHTGRKVNARSFPQLMILPQLFGIELSTQDHDIHHTNNNGNYSKRFKLWDMLFGTYCWAQPSIIIRGP